MCDVHPLQILTATFFSSPGGFVRGSLSSIWYPSVICLAKAEIRKSRIIASLSTAEDGAMSFEEGTRVLVCWCGAVLVWWCCGMLVWCCDSVVVRWCGGVVVWWCGGVEVW